MGATMTKINRKFVQLAGPIAGHDYETRCNAFDAAKDACWQAGAAVWSPIDHVPYIANHQDAMRACLRNLTGSVVDVLVTLDGWEQSEGACLEVAVARAIGVEVMSLEEACE